MPNPALAVVGVTAGTSIIGGVSQSNAAKKATNAQVAADQAAIDEQRRQFDAFQGLLRPYVNAGGPALQGLLNLAGLGGQGGTNWTAYANSNPQLLEAFRAQGGQLQGGPGQAQLPVGPIPPGGVGAPYGLGDTPGYSYGGGALQAQSEFAPATGFTSSVFNNAIAERGGSFQTGAGGRNGLISEVAPQGGGQPLSLEQFAQQYYQQNGGDISQFQQNPQAQAIAQLEEQPLFQSLFQQGEDAILQNASATGGIRGGNTQGALARFRPQLLNQFFNEQYARLAGITELGQNAAAGVGSAGLATGANIGNLLSQQGAARAAGAGAQGQILGSTIGNLGGLFAGALGGNPLSRLTGDASRTIASNPGIF